MNLFRLNLGGCLALLPLWVHGAGEVATDAAPPSGPAHVEVRQVAGEWKLLVNNKPFFIKGAGLQFGDQERLVAHGGNSFRTWSTESRQESGRQMLDRAFKNGLYVTLGLEIARERHGFDYSDPQAVSRQLDELQGDILRFKDHPALLMWDIGNELNLGSTNPAVWTAVNDISKMIHRLDPNHPTTTSIAGLKKDTVDKIKARAPDLDLLSIQMYADIANLPRRLREAGWTGPYCVTEWGASGHWEVGKTGWNAPLEDNSSVKAGFYRTRYERAIASDPAHCLGSYAFLWGQKQERTPTWYGVFLESGAETESVDVLEFLWTGQWPEYRSPQLKSFELAGQTAGKSIRLRPGQVCAARISAVSPSHFPLTYSWELLEETRAQSVGGDAETRPLRLTGLITAEANGVAQLKAPTKPGGYRLFVYAMDNHNKAAYANIPFYVNMESAAVGLTHE